MNNLKNIDNHNVVLFSLDEPRYALHLSAVEKVVHAVEITPLPKAPKIIMGILNFHGDIIPVVDIRKLFHLTSHEITLEDQFIIARTSNRPVVLVVDSVDGVYELGQGQVIDAGNVFPYADYISGVAKIETDIVLINDLDKFLSVNEERILDEALSGEIE
jgi:purine-binding chemotaxis protein CheW